MLQNSPLSSKLKEFTKKYQTSEVVLVKKNLPAKARDVRYTGWIPGWRRSPGGGHGNAVQYSLLENSMDRGAWKVMVLRFAKRQT